MQRHSTNKKTCGIISKSTNPASPNCRILINTHGVFLFSSTIQPKRPSESKTGDVPIASSGLQEWLTGKYDVNDFGKPVFKVTTITGFGNTETHKNLDSADFVPVWDFLLPDL